MHPPATTRRAFLRCALHLPLCLAAAPALAAGRAVKFGVITDVHQDVMPDGVERIRAFVEAMKKAEADFIIHLGDFCQPHPRNQPFLDAWNAFGGPRHHVLGNHDMDGGYKREQTVAFYGMPAKYYRFDAGPVRGLVLDGNDPGGTAKGYKRYIGPEQQAWLKKELADADRPVVLFVHQPLDSGGVENGEAVRAILAPAANKVAAVFSGHLHEDYELEINGIRHVQINSASYVWLTGNAVRETFPAEVHKAHPYLKSAAAYREPLWALVTLDFDRGELTVTGKSSEWIGPDPWQRGAPEKDYPRDRVRPAISDRRIALRNRS